jgi:hypothetical protein
MHRRRSRVPSSPDEDGKAPHAPQRPPVRPDPNVVVWRVVPALLAVGVWNSVVAAVVAEFRFRL